jgi:hypothetical protein
MPKRPTATPNDLLLYIYEHGPVRSKDLEREFVAPKRVSRATMYKYKRQLEAQGKIERRTIMDRPPHYVYFVPDHYRQEVMLLQQYKQMPNNTFFNIDAIPWTDPPDGMYLTKVRHKILWNDPVTGALMVLSKSPVGIPEPIHIHPHANEWCLGLAGELETVDGQRLVMDNTFSFVPKGVRSGVCRVTKELLILIYWDGPITKIAVSDQSTRTC